MAQTGFTPIQLYSSSTTGNTPAAADLLNSSGGSELAINIFDGKLFYKDSSNAVQVIGWKVVPVSAGGTGATSASITAFNNITGYTATGATGTTSTNLVFSTSPTLVTPTIGVATATSINKMAITAPATSSTLAVADGKTFTVSRSLTLTGTDSTTMTFPTTSATIARTDAAQTFTGVQTFSSAPAGAGLSGLATYKVCATGSGTTTISIDLSTVLNAGQGSWLISAQMGQGGATVDVTYSALYLYSVAVIGQTPTLRTVLASDAPGNGNGRIAISGTTVEVFWTGSRGPAFVTAQRLY